MSALGIDVVADLPDVGEHLQDHLEVYVQHACTQPVSAQPALKWRNRPLVGAKWLFGRTGPGATNHFEAGGFVRSNDDVEYPNLMIHFLPLAVRYDGSAPAAAHGYQLHIGPMYSDARGSLKIVSRDPKVHPALRFNYLSTDQDRREWVEAIRVARRLLSQQAFAPFDGGELSPGPEVETDEQILDWVARDAETALHPSCTCRGHAPVGRRPRHDARARARRPACGGRVCDAVRHERQHLRADDDGRREGRRPDPRQRAARAVDREVPPRGHPLKAARIVLDPAFTVAEVDDRIFGSFVEHMGRAVYGGDLRARASDRGRGRLPRRRARARPRARASRWSATPGGNFVSGYDWEDGVGPRDQRPARLDLAWRSLEPNLVGTNEFLTWARRAGAAPMLAVNLGTRGIDSARALVEYCNSPAGSHFADLRRANGRRRPVRGAHLVPRQRDGRAVADRRT